jgi:hypothetical protein
MSLLWITILVFAIGAVIGLTMALAVFKGRFPPVSSAVLHGLFGATGLVLLIVAVFVYGTTGPVQWAFWLFLIAALGGFFIAFGFHAKKKTIPPGIVVVHALIAVVGFLILLAGALKLIA